MIHHSTLNLRVVHAQNLLDLPAGTSRWSITLLLMPLAAATVSVPRCFPRTAGGRVPCALLLALSLRILPIIPWKFSQRGSAYSSTENHSTSVDGFVPRVLTYNAAEAYLSQGSLCSIPFWLLKKKGKRKERNKERKKEIISKKVPALPQAVTRLLVFGTSPDIIKDTMKTGTLAAAV